MNARRSRSESGGFTLIEALVALVVLSFGLLAVAGFQMQLSRGSDLAKQRTQATRLAQEKIEELRSFEQLTARVGKFSYADLATGAEAQQTVGNMVYTRSWTISGSATSPYRTASVTVAWNDRANDAQTVNLISIISRSDPADVGGLAVPTIENGILRRPFSRNINVPIPAISLGDGRSIQQWGGTSGGWLVFSDISGDVISKCNFEPTVSDVTSDPTVCDQLVGYLLVGFINDGSLDNTWPSWWLGTSHQAAIANISGTSTSQECFISIAVDQNSLSPIVGYQYYACLIVGEVGVPLVWTGKLAFNPAPTGNQKVCRYNSNATDGSGVYQNITESLDNQNYQIRESGNCPVGTAQHQP
jgi:type IV pilus modification protein PilV